MDTQSALHARVGFNKIPADVDTLEKEIGAYEGELKTEVQAFKRRLDTTVHSRLHVAKIVLLAGACIIAGVLIRRLLFPKKPGRNHRRN